MKYEKWKIKRRRVERVVRKQKGTDYLDGKHVYARRKEAGAYLKKLINQEAPWQHSK